MLYMWLDEQTVNAHISLLEKPLAKQSLSKLKSG